MDEIATHCTAIARLNATVGALTMLSTFDGYQMGSVQSLYGTDLAGIAIYPHIVPPCEVEDCKSMQDDRGVCGRFLMVAPKLFSTFLNVR